MSLIDGNLVAKATQDFLAWRTPSMSYANTKFSNIRGIDQINFGAAVDVYVQDYVTAGIDSDAISGTSSILNIDKKKSATYNYDPVTLLQAADPNLTAKMSSRCAWQLMRGLEQDNGTELVSAAGTSLTAGALNVNNVFDTFGHGGASLYRAAGNEGTNVALVDIDVANLISGQTKDDGFMLGDDAIRNGYYRIFNGLKVIVSNDLPTTQSLTVDTQPSAGETVTAGGVTWTLIADSGTAVAGEMKVGANLADFQAILLAALNGATAPNTGDYVDVSATQRRKLQNMGFVATAFASNVMVINGFGKITGTETMASANNEFATEQISIFFMKKGALSLAIQADSIVSDRPAQLPSGKVSHANDFILTKVHGRKVFSNQVDEVVQMQYNAISY